MTKKKKSLSIGIAAICLTAGLAFGLSACDDSQTPTDNLLTMQDVYAKAQELGFEGTLEDLIAMFKGEKGEKGDTGSQGEKGEKGDTGAQGVGIASVAIDENGKLVITLTDGTKLPGVELPSGSVENTNETTQGLLYQKIANEEAYQVAGIGQATDIDIVLPSTYRGLPVKGIAKSVFEGYDKQFTIKLPDTITFIGERAFYNCKNLAMVEFSSNLLEIGGSAFYSCSKIVEIELPNNLQRIGNNTFENCSSLTSATIGNSVTSIGERAFEDCSNLTSITIPDSVTSIGGSAFKDCSKLTSVTIGNSVASIGGGAFYNCSSLKYNEYDNAKYLGNETNKYLWLMKAKSTTITSCTIHENCRFIYSSAFSGCSKLEEITIPFVGAEAGKTSSDTYQYPFGYIFGTYSYTGGTATTQCYYGSSTSSITSNTYYIPSTLKKVTVTGGNILLGAFYGCSGLTSVIIPDSVTSIGEYSFSGCSSLTSVTIGNSVTSIGDYAFDYCSSLENIYITDIESWCKIRNLYDLMRYGSSNKKLYLNNTLLTDLVIPDGVISIGRGMFYNCSSLTSITIPDSVTSIEYQAFSDCSGLTSVYYRGTIDDWAKIRIYDNSNLTFATRYYYSATQPTTSGNYWHYNDKGEIEIW